MSLLWETNPAAADGVRLALGGTVTLVDSGPGAMRRLTQDAVTDLLVIGASVELSAALDVAEQLRLRRPEVGIVLLRHRLEVAVLTQAIRAGIREVVPADEMSSLGQAARRSHELSQRLSERGGGTAVHDGRVTTVFAAKGGVGKTTISTNLAVELAAGSRVLLVDLDLAFGDVGIALGLPVERNITDLVAMTGHLDEQGLASAVVHHKSGLEVICAPPLPEDAEKVPAATVTELLRVARRVYDHVVVDTPPAFTDHVLAAFDASDVSVLIGTLDIPALKNLRLTLDTLDQLGHPRDAWVLVLNRSDAKVGLNAADVVATLQRPVAVEVPSSLAVPSSTNSGEVLVTAQPKHAVSQAIKTLAREHVRVASPTVVLAAPLTAGQQAVPTAQLVTAGQAPSAPRSASTSPFRVFRRSQA